MSFCRSCAAKVSTCCPGCLSQIPDPLVVEMLTDLARRAWRHCFLKRPQYDPFTYAESYGISKWRKENGWYEMQSALAYAKKQQTALVAANGGVLPAVVAKQIDQTTTKLAGWRLKGYTW